jgi:hypothetical protein
MSELSSHEPSDIFLRWPRPDPAGGGLHAEQRAIPVKGPTLTAAIGRRRAKQARRRSPRASTTRLDRRQQDRSFHSRRLSRPRHGAAGMTTTSPVGNLFERLPSPNTVFGFSPRADTRKAGPTFCECAQKSTAVWTLRLGPPHSAQSRM